MAEIEVAAIPDPERRRRVEILLPRKGKSIRISRAILKRAEAFIKLGLAAPDAVHVAAAETGNADVLLTCDDKLIAWALRNQRTIRIDIGNPIDWLREQTDAANT